MVVLIFILFLGPIRPQTSRNLVKQLLRFALFTFVAMLVIGEFAKSNPQLFGNLQGDTSPTSGGGEATPFSPPEVSKGAEFWITTLLILFVGGLTIFAFNRFLNRWFQPKPLEEIADIARSTLRELGREKPSRNAIIRCYTRMNDVVDERRGISRHMSMTPAEFAVQLVGVGLPGEAVQELTRVFERVRYGAQTVGAQEIKEAKQCLSEILKACETKP